MPPEFTEKKKEYQTFDDQEGMSDSVAKLQKLMLPNLNGKRFLDIGCNEGFFCIHAQNSGASRVVGIDANRAIIEKARNRAPDIEYHAQSWDRPLPEGPFDCILYSSALQYAKNPRKLFRAIYDALDPDGLLVLECGVSFDKEKRWVTTPRVQSVVRYPTRSLLFENLLEDFSVRLIGGSVNPEGDPMPRFVMHCSPFHPIVMFLGGAPKIGKSTLAFELSKHGVRHIKYDALLQEVYHNPFQVRSPLFDFVKEHYPSQGIGPLTKAIVANNLGAELAHYIADTYDDTFRISIIEGFGLKFSEILKPLRDRLEKQHRCRIWNIA